MALSVVLSVMSGFEQDLKKKILGTNAHAIVLKFGPFDEWQKAAGRGPQGPRAWSASRPSSSTR